MNKHTKKELNIFELEEVTINIIEFINKNSYILSIINKSFNNLYKKKYGLNTSTKNIFSNFLQVIT